MSNLYDVFISHANEDKEIFVRELVSRLKQKGYGVWYDEFTLKLGDSLRRSIDQGLSQSKYGVVVLSPNFLRKEWTQRELDGLAARENAGQKVILPIWHQVSFEEILKYSPILADRFGVSTSQGLDYVVSQIIDVLGLPVASFQPNVTIDTLKSDQTTAEAPYLDDQNWHCNCTMSVRSGSILSTVFSAAVNTVTFSSDGKILFSASEDWDEPIKLWNPNTGQEIRLMGGWKLGRFASIAISSNGQILVIGGTIIELWNLVTQQKIGELGSLFGHRDIAALAISPDHRILASSSLGESPFNFRDYAIKLWRLDTKENICNLKGHSAGVNSLAFSRDGHILASASKDSTIKLWNTTTLEEIYTLPGHRGNVNSIQFSRDNQILASGGEDSQIKLWNPHTGRITTTLIGHSGGITSIAISPDNLLLASASKDSKIKLWDLNKKQEICSLEGHSGEVRSVAFSPNGKMIASGSRDAKIKIWQLSI
ncbi:MAG: hypothetical protein C6Y22_00450 [Hapalosiphonaceae cyanobacterium JJU2]|nr:MAG: hypothetical protein C6Y22_00450 [Hapalosiphonaceae cyanobacterium JJU2]